MVLALEGEPDIVVMTAGGMVLRVRTREIRAMGRDTQGVKLVQLAPGDRVVDVAVLQEEDEETGGEQPTGDGDGEGGDDAQDEIGGNGGPGGAGEPPGPPKSG
jgi:DNA gyrase subunit A